MARTQQRTPDELVAFVTGSLAAKLILTNASTVVDTSLVTSAVQNITLNQGLPAAKRAAALSFLAGSSAASVIANSVIVATSTVQVLTARPAPPPVVVPTPQPKPKPQPAPRPIPFPTPGPHPPIRPEVTSLGTPAPLQATPLTHGQFVAAAIGAQQTEFPDNDPPLEQDFWDDLVGALLAIPIVVLIDLTPAGTAGTALEHLAGVLSDLGLSFSEEIVREQWAEAVDAAVDKSIQEVDAGLPEFPPTPAPDPPSDPEVPIGPPSPEPGGPEPQAPPVPGPEPEPEPEPDPSPDPDPEPEPSPDPSPDPGGPDPGGPDPAGPDPAGPDPAGPDPAGPDPAGPDPAGPDPAGPDPAGPDPGGPDPGGPDPGGPEPEPGPEHPHPPIDVEDVPRFTTGAAPKLPKGRR